MCLDCVSKGIALMMIKRKEEQSISLRSDSSRDKPRRQTVSSKEVNVADGEGFYEQEKS